MRRISIWLIHIGVCLSVCGCMTVKTGTTGALAFRYDPGILIGERTPEPGRRIAAGTLVTLIVDRVSPGTIWSGNQPAWSGPQPRSVVVLGGSDETTVTKAKSMRDEVLTVVGVDGNRVVLEARSPGATEVVFTTPEATDGLDVHVEAVGRVEVRYLAVRHRAGDMFPRAVAFVRGGRARFMRSLYDAQGNSLIGAGGPGRVAVVPHEAAEVTTDLNGIPDLLVRFRSAGSVTLQPENGEPLTLEVVEPAAVVAVEILAWSLFGPHRWPDELTAGDNLIVELLGRLADSRPVIGTDDLVKLVSRTPEICEVRKIAGWADGLWLLTARNHGECRLTTHLAETRTERRLIVRPKG